MDSISESLHNITSKLSESWSEFGRDQSTLTTTALVVGYGALLYFAIYVVLELIQAFRLYVLSQYCCKANFIERYGRWAVVSGATDGIGQAMARELALRGMSVVVIGRNTEKLARTKAMLEQVPNAGQVETVKIDLADSSLENFNQVRAQIDPDNRDIGILVNNAGTFPVRYARFNRFEMDEIASMVNLNVLATLHLTRMIMPGMVGRSRGLIVNVSSGLGAVSMPYFNVYGATKAFVSSFTRQLQMEYSAHPIDIVLLQTGPVGTDRFKALTGEQRGPFMVPTPASYAKSAINALAARCPVYAGVAYHGLMLNALKLADKLNIVPALIKASEPSFRLSPVAKRKRVAKSQTGSGRVDETNVESVALTVQSGAS